MVFVRVQKIVYHTVILHTNSAAQCFIASLEPHPEFAVSAVRMLYIGIAVQNEHATRILHLCKGITDLTLHAVCHHLHVENPLLEPLDALPLFSLSTDLSGIFHNQCSYLPNLLVAHRITCLHLTNTWSSWTGFPVGLTRLIQLTHLSIPWTMSCSDFSLFRKILASINLKVLVLWRDEYERYGILVDNLQREGLDNCHIVCLNSVLYSSYLVYGGFGGYAEELVKWREKVNGMTFSPIQCYTLLSKCISKTI